MFIIIGGDGKEYGPVTIDQVRAWMAAGRANFDTKAKALGSEEWRRVGDYAEFTEPTGTPPVVRLPDSGMAGTTPVAVTAQAPLADRGTRLGARVIDWAIEFICAIPGGAILGSEALQIAMKMAQGEQPDFGQINMQRVILGGLILFGAWLLLLVIQVWLLTTRGQSIGKLLMKVRIVRFADGSAPGIVYAWLLREIPMTAIGFLLGLFPFAGPFLLRPAFHVTDWCLIFRADQRCLHDLIAGTKVVRVAPKDPFRTS